MDYPLRGRNLPLFGVPAGREDEFPYRLLGRNHVPKGTMPRTVPTALEIDAGLEPRETPLDARRATHLIRRAAFGGSPESVDALVGMPASEAAAALVSEAVDAYGLDEPEWADDALPRDRVEREAYLNETNPARLEEFYASIMSALVHGGLRERMMLFWHNHFVTQLSSYFIAPYAWRYVETLHSHALGNFRDFVHAVGLDPAMLIYLNGAQNFVGEPNENYARELLELFTMGQYDSGGNENYSQSDIVEIARALTGILVDPYELTVTFVPLFHDHDEKTIMGRTGNWGYDDVVSILFEERAPQIAEFLAAKLYREFVYAAPDPDIVAGLAETVLDNDFEIAPVVEKLLASEHIHHDEVIGTRIKSPVELTVGMARESAAELVDDHYLLLYFLAFILDQRVLDPPNVAGWEGHHSWVNTSTLATRWLVGEYLVFGDRVQYPEWDLTEAATRLISNLDETIDPIDGRSVFPLAVELARHFLAVPLETLDLSTPDGGFVGDLVGHPIPQDVLDGPEHELALAQIFLLGALPWYEWRMDHRQAPVIMNLYLRFLSQLPEFQLT